MSDVPGTSLPFWHLIVIRALRLAVRLALQSRRISVSSLKNLLEVAVFQEMQAQNYTIHAMSLVLDCSPRSVNTYSARARATEDALRSQGTVPRLLDAFLKGPLSLAQVAALVRTNNEFDPTRVTLRILLSEGLIELADEQKPTYRLTPRGQHSAPWEKPLSQLEHLYAYGLTVLQCLGQSMFTAQQLNADSRLKKLPLDRLTDVLKFLEQAEYLESRAIGAHMTPQYRARTEMITLIPPTRDARLRVGLLDLLDKLALCIESILEQPEPRVFGQRGYLFTAKPDDLQAFVREHRNEVVEQLNAMEARARTDGDGRPCVMAWAIAPLQEQTPRGHKPGDGASGRRRPANKPRK